MPKSYMRTDETEKIYDQHKKEREQQGDRQCPICTAESVREYDYWKLIENEFPYDRVARDHYMLASKRHIATFSELTDAEQQEFRDIHESINEFDASLFNFAHRQTVDTHYHIHLFKYREREDE